MGLKIKKNDTVLVIAGDYKGKQGRVLKVFPREDKAIVEHVNMVKRHTRPRTNQQGGILEKEAPIQLSNLMVICKSCNQVTRVARKTMEDGTRVRVCKRCGEMLDAV
ncbi:MAG: 50S ribosomal protein L24 [Candidatus Latescibacterota bacterium]|nr:MAG: 50S ribosomal protein L24 [Candidatus Latescibacterota bacterium]RKY72955.1 MAG: 50S ribosomal protein L24 [Candidatus Latescibacterota bacterium]